MEIYQEIKERKLQEEQEAKKAENEKETLSHSIMNRNFQERN
ncbi:MAG: hypothetical protein WCY58_00505 [Mariniphaga sp.]